jgi:hypothetical protein
MPTTERPSGVRVTVPADYSVMAEAKPSAIRRGAPPRSFGPIPLATESGTRSAEHDAILDALRQQDLELVDDISLHPTPPDVQRRSISEPSTAEVSVDLEPQEDAVLLLEQDGFYSWSLPASSESLAAHKEAGGVRAIAPKRKVTFRVDLPTARTPVKSPSKRGFVQDFVYGRVRAFVLRFAARIAVETGLKFLEKNVRKGIVQVTSTDPAQWTLIPDISSLHLPDDRPARVLLLIHGTFSSTVGAFGALGSTPWGKAFLQAALATYDAIIGFDHPTLSEDPLQNATDLLKYLESMTGKYPPHFDVVTHSRGALVFRGLVESLVPLTRWQGRFDRVIFVAGTNGGTLLAQPENWQQFIDLYTNLAVAGCRLLGLMPTAKAVTLVLQETIQGLGSFLKYLATTIGDERKVPGIAAMEPKGSFVTGLNQEQPGQPDLSSTFYCAITSEFEPHLANGESRPKELPVRFLEWTLEVLAKQIMEKEPNDLVVNLSSMTAIDEQLGNFIKDSVEFGKNPDVYHTNYFCQPAVANALSRWLRLAQTPTQKPAPQTRGYFKTKAARFKVSKVRGRGASKATAAASGAQPPATGAFSVARGGAMARPIRVAALDTDFIVKHADTPIFDVVKSIKKESPSFVVVSRPYRGRTLNYAFRSEEILEHPRASLAEPLMDALNLHETDSSETAPGIEGLSESALQRIRSSNVPSARRAVILSKQRVAGVLPEEPFKIRYSHLPDDVDIVALAKAAVKPQTVQDRILMRRAMPTLEPPVSRDRAEASTPTVTCYFHAEIDDEVVVKRVTTIEVRVSREVIGRLAGAAAAGGQAAIDRRRKLIIQVIPRLNFETVEATRAEIDPPEPGKSQMLMFDVRPTDVGASEIWIVVRQDQVPLVTLVLKPAIVESKTSSARKVSIDATTGEAPRTSRPLHQLYIIEQRNGDQVSYLYQLMSPDLKLLEWTNSKPFIGDRQKYVDDLYKEIEKRWISTNSDVNAFNEELRAFGGELLDQLIPADLQKTLWEYRNKLQSIMVISTEPFIPWELVHLKEPGKKLAAATQFLAQLGLVRWLHEAGWPPERIQIRQGLARSVIPNYPHPDYVLKEAALEFKFLKDRFTAVAVDPHPNPVRELLQEPGSFDLLHFACHGYAEHDNISNAQLMMEGRVEAGNYVPEYLSAATAAQFGELETKDNQPMVVLNACQAARAGYSLTGIGGFARAFISSGAGCFVGALWSVGDQPARTFTETMYGELLKGSTLAKATIAARKGSQQAGDATWLAYAVYGHPYMKIQTSKR